MTTDMGALSRQVQDLIEDVPDFPKPGIIFKDLTPVFLHGPTLEKLIEGFADRYREQSVDVFVAIESRGFLLGAPLAAALGKGLALVRKPGKLPRATRSKSYELEYGQDTLEMHHDALAGGARVVVVDDLLATGGTMEATCEMVKEAGAEVVEASFLVELTFLEGRKRLDGVPCFSLVQYD